MNFSALNGQAIVKISQCTLNEQNEKKNEQKCS